MKKEKGFTLIELLVVIAIVAILAAVVIITLNPAELLKQSRDARRLREVATLVKTLSIYMTDVSPISMGASTNCYAHSNSGANCTGRFSGGGTPVTTSSLSVDGTGWLPVNIAAMTAPPIQNLPKDPINNTVYFYAFKANTSTNSFELTTKMESSKYSSNGSGDVESKDGGSIATLFETGNSLSL